MCVEHKKCHFPRTGSQYPVIVQERVPTQSTIPWHHSTVHQAPCLGRGVLLFDRSRENGHIWACVREHKSAIFPGPDLSTPSEFRNESLLIPPYPGIIPQCTRRQVPAEEFSCLTDRVKMVTFGHVCGSTKVSFSQDRSSTTRQSSGTSPYSFHRTLASFHRTGEVSTGLRMRISGRVCVRNVFPHFISPAREF